MYVRMCRYLHTSGTDVNGKFNLNNTVNTHSSFVTYTFPMGRNVQSVIRFMYSTEDSLWGHERPRYGTLHYLACSRAAIGTVDTRL